MNAPDPSPSTEDHLLTRSLLLGLVDLYILAAADRAPVYGRSIRRSLHDLGYEISPGRLYPLLRSLVGQGLLTPHTRLVSGRERKYYELTTRGQERLGRARELLPPTLRRVLHEGDAVPRAGCPSV